MLNSVYWKNNNNAYERKQDFKIASSLRNAAVRALIKQLTLTVNLLDINSDSSSFHG